MVISAYNRAERLAEALERLLAQKAGATRYEIVVADNNSTDRTREVIQAFAARSNGRVRYVFEGRQGVSFGRNTGVAASSAPIIAFTDDDMLMAPDWVANIQRAFAERPAIDYVGGKALPLWPDQPPRWLTPTHWSPLALLDYGDEPMPIDAEHRRALITANFAIRRATFDRVGGFSPLAQRTAGNLGTAEDHDLLLRLWRAGARGEYRPELLGWTEASRDRLTKNYHRRWRRGHGRCLALIRDEELEASTRGRLFDVPAHLFRQAAVDAAQCLINRLKGDEEIAFLRETRLWFFAGFVRQRCRDYLRRGTSWHLVPPRSEWDKMPACPTRSETE